MTVLHSVPDDMEGSVKFIYETEPIEISDKE